MTRTQRLPNAGTVAEPPIAPIAPPSCGCPRCAELERLLAEHKRALHAAEDEIDTLRHALGVRDIAL